MRSQSDLSPALNDALRSERLLSALLARGPRPSRSAAPGSDRPLGASYGDVGDPPALPADDPDPEVVSVEAVPVENIDIVRLGRSIGCGDDGGLAAVGDDGDVGEPGSECGTPWSVGEIGWLVVEVGGLEDRD